MHQCKCLHLFGHEQEKTRSASCHSNSAAEGSRWYVNTGGFVSSWIFGQDLAGDVANMADDALVDA